MKKLNIKEKNDCYTFLGLELQLKHNLFYDNALLRPLFIFLSLQEIYLLVFMEVPSR